MEAEAQKEYQLVIITGMSGAGKTVAIQSFEDLGFFCVDNLPPTLLPKFIELVGESDGKMNKVALGMDLRGREFFDALIEMVDNPEVTDRFKIEIYFLMQKIKYSFKDIKKHVVPTRLLKKSAA